MIRIEVDLTNPGQFFGCCGVFELAQRMWPGATAYFEGAHFVVSDGELKDLVERAMNAPLINLAESDAAASPMLLGGPFNLRLDWWKDIGGGGRQLKTWAGSMQGPRIARAMRSFLGRCFATTLPFDYGMLVTDAQGEKAEPFYFDARRSGAASGLDTGFSVNDLKGSATVSFPAVEFLALVGLQRFRPHRQGVAFYFQAWQEPLTITLAPLVAGRAIERPARRWKYSTPFHTKYAKSFSAAIPVNGDEDE